MPTVEVGETSRRCGRCGLLWLSRAEGEEAYVSNKITALKCKANQYLSPVKSQFNSFWKKVSASVESVFGVSFEPIRSLFRYFTLTLSACLDWIMNLLSFAFRQMFSLMGFIGDVFAHFWHIFTDFFDDLVTKKDDISTGIYSFFAQAFSPIVFALGWVGNLLVNALKGLKMLFHMDPSSDIKIEAMNSYPTARDLDIHWAELKNRILELETELRKVKEEKSAGTEIYQKQLENNHKALQKYQVIVNDALRRQSVKPVQLSKSSLQYYLDGLSDEIKKWMTTHFVLKSDSKDIDENKFETMMAKYGNKSDKEIKGLQSEFSRFVKHYTAELSSLKTDLNLAQYHDLNGNEVPMSLIKRIVADEIKLHDADKTGKVDYALESAGGHVLSVKCTEPYDYCLKYSNIFGWNVCAQQRRNAPEEAINPGMAPGQCWAFSGSQGFLILELSHSILVTGFTMEHVSRLLSPNGRIDSAPRKFSMWGLKSTLDQDSFLLGNYEYKDNNETYQYFPVLNYSSKPFKIVELVIESNHGNPNFTCLYRIRVHGEVYPSHL